MVTATTITPMRQVPARAPAPQAAADALALVGHELRTPLTTLGSVLDLLSESASDDTAFLLTRARREVKRLSLLFEASLRSTELVTRAQYETDDMCDAAAVIDGLVAAIDPADYGVQVTAQVEPALNAAIDGDALTVIVNNLLVNAFRHARAKHIAISARRGDGEIIICIDDDGIGLAAASAQGTRRSIGGLGLVVVEQLLQRFGGSLTTRSAPGQGTWCTVTVPEVGA